MMDLHERHEHNPGQERADTLAQSTVSMACDSRSHASRLPLALDFLAQKWREIDVMLDPNERALWCHMHHTQRPSFTPALLEELNGLHRSIRHMFASISPGEEPPFDFFVGGSRLPGVFNLGGDLGLFLKHIRAGDREALRNYAFSCVEAIYNNADGFGAPVVSICLLQGDALGGGFEAALSFHVLVAERGVKMGFPEVLFNSFPGMGAFSLLCRRLNATQARKMMLSGRMYSAEECYEMGIIDILVDQGEGVDAVRNYLNENKRRHPLLHSMNKVSRRINPMSLEELRDITDIWVDHSMGLDRMDLRRMERITGAQDRRSPVRA